jgi:hypothetical protein
MFAGAVTIGIVIVFVAAIATDEFLSLLLSLATAQHRRQRQS